MGIGSFVFSWGDMGKEQAVRDLENRERKTPQEIRISVRGLVEFVLRHGDIDNRHKASPDNAMQEGGRDRKSVV